VGNGPISLFFRLATAVPEIDDFYHIVVYPVDKLVQVSHDDTSVGHWGICKKRFQRTKEWITAQKFHNAMDFISEFHSRFFAKLVLDVSSRSQDFLLGLIFNFDSHNAS
jgi:hypothetical protein